MFNKSELDERQLLMRGNVYQHMVILYVMILMLDSFLTSFDIKWVDGIYIDNLELDINVKKNARQII